jgi:thermolabile hemolysin
MSFLCQLGHLYKKNTIYLFFFVIASSVASLASEEYRLACHYFDKYNPKENSSFFHAGLPWLWAETKGGEAVYMRGRLIDGFLEVEQLVGKTGAWYGWLELASLENSYKTAHSLCSRALEVSFPETYQQKEVLGIVAATSFLSTYKIPVVFKNQSHLSEQAINKIVAFGDSSLDQSNLKGFLRALPNSDYFGGRFTNGRNWLDYLQHNNFNQPENDECSISDKLRESSYAMISGTVDQQIIEYKSEYLTDGVIKDSEKTMFALMAGGNDYFLHLNSPYKLNYFIDEPERENYGSNAVARVVVANLMAHIDMLKNMGAKKIMVGNLPDLGALPRIFEVIKNHDGGLLSEEEHLIKISKRLTEISKYHNHILRESINSFNAKHLEMKVIYIDIFSGMKAPLNFVHIFNPLKYFNYELDPDFILQLHYRQESTMIYKACYSGYFSSLSEEKICAAPNRTMFWDSVHPSTFAHCLLAQGIHQKLFENSLMGKPSMKSYLARCRPELVR